MTENVRLLKTMGMTSLADSSIPSASNGAPYERRPLQVRRPITCSARIAEVADPEGGVFPRAVGRRRGGARSSGRGRTTPRMAQRAPQAHRSPGSSPSPRYGIVKPARIRLRRRTRRLP